MSNRRNFLKKTALGSLIWGGTWPMTSTLAAHEKASHQKSNKHVRLKSSPVVVATWNNQKANKAAWQVLSQNGAALDAVEAGVMVPEADPNDRSVGYGGRPDRDGRVTLDACIMDQDGNCGSVAFLEHIKHPVKVARLVMEKTPHVMLTGSGALQFALENGFKKEDLLTEESEKEWKEWKKTAKYKPVINIENHDTIGMVALDQSGDLSGACTTSGTAWKMRGRVGDSPIIGAGLYVDNEVGAATATGLGEAVIKVVGSYLVVELMRQGNTPEEACRLALERMAEKVPQYREFQVGFLALNKQGEFGAYSIHSGFSFAVHQEGNGSVTAAKSILD